MSVQARQSIADSHNIVFRSFQQRNDILVGVQTQLIDLLQYLVGHGALFVVTALKSDHSDDTSKCKSGPPYSGTHAHGWSVDCWPLALPQDGKYLDPADPQMQHFLRLVAGAPHLLQIGLGGSAVTPLNILAAGPTYFEDDGDDHVHIGTQLVGPT